MYMYIYIYIYRHAHAFAYAPQRCTHREIAPQHFGVRWFNTRCVPKRGYFMCTSAHAPTGKPQINSHKLICELYIVKLQV